MNCPLSGKPVFLFLRPVRWENLRGMVGFFILILEICNNLSFLVVAIQKSYIFHNDDDDDGTQPLPIT